MNTVTIIIKDVNDSIEVEGRLEKDALDHPPTMALVMGTYISTNVEKIAKDSLKWFSDQVKQDVETDTPRLFVPKQTDLAQ